MAHNLEHNITPTTVKKALRNTFADAQKSSVTFKGAQDIEKLKMEMRRLAQRQQFEKAAEIRDMINKLQEAGVRSKEY